EIAREHMELCIKSGIKMAGINAEVMPAQWEFQIGPSDILTVSDDLVMARYILSRLLSNYKMNVSFHPKPKKGNWNGSGCHINFSTKETRQSYEAILNAITSLGNHYEKIGDYYGDNNNERLTGEHETSSANKFTFGVGTRNTSIRIPQ